eukprot:GHVR01035340.1.p1 GENE.GHVR01035340.1~~GHVR01035340.1.p1  ORF type:complete len:139 (-),score=10.44 GHVR01035340.1:90-506(-)
MIGDAAECARELEQKILKWETALKQLTTIAKENPQAAYAAYTLSMSNLWKYIQRITPATATAFHTLDEVIATQFIPALFGSYVAPQELEIVSLPTAYGGLGLEAPSTTANSAYAGSHQATAHLSATIKGQELFSFDTH